MAAINFPVSDPWFLQLLTQPLDPFNITNLGERVLRGIISCIVRAHKGGRAYNGELAVQNFRVTCYSWIPGNGNANIILETASVDIHGDVMSYHLTVENQAADYAGLSVIIRQVFVMLPRPSHVESIALTLDHLHNLEAQLPPPPEYPSDLLLRRRTQLLQALAAMTDPLVMATMFWNLFRFMESLRMPQQKGAFNNAVLQTGHINWCDTARSDVNFTKTFTFRNRAWEYEAEDDGRGLLRFARNWFTHAPGQTGHMRNLDSIFSFYFPHFMPALLRQLYLSFDLSTFLVPLS